MTRSDEYKEWVAGVFDRSSASYDRVGPRFFTHFGRGLVEFAEIRPGSRVLDVACGRGAVLIPAAHSTGESGEVIGIDISPGMVRRLETDLNRSGLSNSSVRVMDAEELRFEDSSFHYVLCGLALFFLPNLEVAFNECLRVLRPEGHLVVSTIEAIETPWRESVRDVIKSYSGKVACAPIMDTKALDREDEVTEELKAAGFVGIEHKVATKESTFCDEKEWWDTEWSIFRRAFMERLDPDSLEEYRREVLDIVREWRTDSGIPTTVSVRYSRAEKPAGSVIGDFLRPSP